MDTTQEFWQYLDQLAAGSRLVVDRPKGSSHPRFPGQVYPLDYGYLDGTTSVDGGGVDAWIGSLIDRGVTGVLCTVDLLKKDGELKILIGCDPKDVEHILQFVNSHSMRAIYISRQVGA